MSLQKTVLSVVAGCCICFPVMAQEHPDATKLVEDTADNVAVAQEYVQQGMTYYTDYVNLVNFDYQGALLGTVFVLGAAYANSYLASDDIASAGNAADQVSDATQNTQESADAAGVSSGLNEETETAQVETIAVKQLKVGEVGGSGVLNSILPIDSLPPIVPEDIAPLLEEEQPDPVQVKEKIAENVLIDKSNPERLYVTQDLQNRLVAAGVMRALDNAKRSFELSAKAQQEIDEDRQKVESSASFTGILSATAAATVHSYQKLNEIKGLYAQLMELEALNSLRGSELTDEEREKRAKDAAGEGAVATASMTQVQATGNQAQAAESKLSYDSYYACGKSYLKNQFENLLNSKTLNLTTKQKEDGRVKHQEKMTAIEERYQAFKTCEAGGGDSKACFAPVLRALNSQGGLGLYTECKGK